MDDQIDDQVTGRIDAEKIVFHQESQLKNRLAKIKTYMVEHGPGILDQYVGIGQDLEINRVPERSPENSPKGPRNHGKQRQEYREMNLEGFPEGKDFVFPFKIFH